MDRPKFRLRSLSGHLPGTKTRLPALGLLLSLGAFGSMLAQGTQAAAPPESLEKRSPAEDTEITELRQRIVRLEQVLEHQAQDDVSVGQTTVNINTVEEGQWDLQEARCESPVRRYPTAKLSGFLQFDSAWFGESAATRAAFGDIADSTAVRRARLAVSGDVYTDIGYKLDFDFAASGHPSFRDMVVEFRKRLFANRIVVGFFKAPFQLDALTSSRDFTFAERPPFFTFAPFRQIGVGANGTFASERATWSVAGFRTGTDGFAVAQSDDGYGLAARSTVLPVYADNGRALFHIGFDYSYTQPNDNSLEYDSKLDFFVDEEPGGTTTNIPPLVDTGPIAAQGVNLFDCELAGTLGASHFQAEVTYALVDQIGASPLTFYGGYAQIGWFLTGETRPYDRPTGVFTTIQPRHDLCKGGLGAWEVAFRGTYLNLNDENIRGGRLDSIGFVVNWYLNKRLSLKFDCVRGFIANPTAGDVELDICGTRLQVIY